jgi:uncharacterized lipoprotein YajG
MRSIGLSFMNYHHGVTTMKSIAIICAVILTGCAAPQQQAQISPAQRQAYLACKYETDVATASIRNPFSAGIKQAQLTQQCMQARGY